MFKELISEIAHQLFKDEALTFHGVSGEVYKEAIFGYCVTEISDEIDLVPFQLVFKKLNKMADQLFKEALTSIIFSIHGR